MFPAAAIFWAIAGAKPRRGVIIERIEELEPPRPVPSREARDVPPAEFETNVTT